MKCLRILLSTPLTTSETREVLALKAHPPNNIVQKQLLNFIRTPNTKLLRPDFIDFLYTLRPNRLIRRHDKQKSTNAQASKQLTSQYKNRKKRGCTEDASIPRH
jgi:hypothetical protein